MSQQKHTPANPSRRQFMRISSLASLGLTIGYATRGFGRNQTFDWWHGETAEKAGIRLTAWISIDKQGKVTLVNHRSEMGQGSYQSVPQVIAEELEVDMDAIDIVFAPGTPGTYGSQITGGSSTIRGSYQQLLRTGAAARTMLISAAASQWAVPEKECIARSGQVIHQPTGRKLGYGELVEAAAKLPVPTQVALKPRSQYRLIGKPLPRADTPAKLNGQAIFGLDKTLPGMLYAVVERSPRFHGKVKSYDEARVKAMPGVKAVFKVTMPVFSSSREGVAVVATSTWAALQARKQLQVQWDDSGFEHLDTDGLYARMAKDLELPGNSIRTGGNLASGLAKASKKVEATYRTPYQAHACMEPLNCVAHYTPEKVVVWGPIQAPDWVQSDLADRLSMKPEQIEVNMTFLGGGFGRKAFTDYTAEAVFISREAKAPVKVVWTREDDMTQGPFRPGAMYKLQAGLAESGRIEAFGTRMAGQNMGLQDSPRFDKEAFNAEVLEGLCEPYIESFRHYAFSDVPTQAPIPVMWWRSVYSSTNVFAYESFVDECAHAAGKDPLAYRRQHLRNERHQAILAKLEEMTQWKSRGKNSGWGIAIGQCFGSIVGEAVKVRKAEGGGVQVEKTVVVMDCGWYVNPDIIKAQIEGSLYMALGAATTHETHFAEGKAVETNFTQYNLPRMGSLGTIEVHIMDNEEKPGGVGEPALPPFAPALCNAIFDLTGKRLRSLPFRLEEV